MKRLCMLLIRFYQRAISPYKGVSSCRFIPTCSEYAYQAFEKYGFFKGGYLAARRLLRCHPFCKGGYDPLE
ncbi:MAG: membrane protein insertion efficiency factor YidD [Clostridia bacterium]|nr:membrane protein insertion efficiency factor YidD [Clostridia bacterium]